MKIDTEEQLAAPQQELCQQLLIEKYAHQGETTVAHIHTRVARATAATQGQGQAFMELLENFTPGGRICRAAGTGSKATSINCFVQPIGDTMSGVDDEGMPGITDALRQAAETMRRGGGVGYDFSRIRPMGAWVEGTQSRASGPVSMMRMFDVMCSTVESAGARRGAQMGILRIDHPDIEQFIDAKKAPSFAEMGLDERGEAGLMGLMRTHSSFAWQLRSAFATLSNFNISCAITDEFMEAVVQDADFDLVHAARPVAMPENRVKLRDDGSQVYVYKTVKARALWDRIMRNTYSGAEPGVIFIDHVNRSNSLRYIETISASNPCGEQMLPAHGCCDLGALMLQNFVQDSFTDRARFNWAEFKKSIPPAVEFLDRVLDTTVWPLPEQRVEAETKRRIGMGFMGLGDALARLGLRYDSPEGVEFGRSVAEVMRDEAYMASVELAKKLGAFPFFDAEKYLEEGTFASRLPTHIQEQIRKHGIRNSHLLSIAPTGTTAMAFGDNTSSGIEPIFALRQKRSKLMSNGSRQEIYLENAAYRAFKMAHGSDATSEAFVTALEMSVDAHLAMLEAVAPFIDSAISKTVNVPVDYPFEDFSSVYMRAWQAGLKGITTYRPSEMRGSVISDASAIADAPPSHDPDRRIELKDAANVLDALKWPSRPKTPGGLDSATYSIEHPDGDFAVVIGHYTRGGRQPIEVFVAGAEQPRGLAAIAKVLSVDMRTGDSKWLQHKLDSLRNTEANDAFDMVHPESGQSVRMPSLVAGFALVVEHRLQVLGSSPVDQPGGMTDYLFVKKEPKTGARGGIGWHVDIKNHSSGDDFVMWVKEVQMPDQTVRPISVWLAGTYPKVLDGLCKMLSIDMQVSNPEWILKKLRSLLTLGELHGHFLAEVPGESRQQSYPSTVAYLAALLIDRYKVLGLTGATLLAHESTDSALVQAREDSYIGSGALCSSCKTMSMHRRDGCTTCANCGHQGGCG